MRLIDADALIERMYHDAFETDTDMQKWDSGCWIRYKMFENAMDSAPTIDAVEVVRKPIKGYEGYYEVDQLGRVFSLDRTVFVEDHDRKYNKLLKGSQLKQHMHTAGYKTVCLTKDGKSKTQYVHRLVAEAFIPNPEELPFINHKDEDKTNNFVDNLEWCTVQYNNTYGKARERHAKKIRSRSLSAEHKKKISESLKRYFQENKR